MPEQKPSAESLCPLRRSATIQESPAAAVATKVFIIARAAEPLASSAEPALKPNQPTQSRPVPMPRSEEHTSELQSLMRISYAVFCLKKKRDSTNSKPTSITYM